MAAKLLKNLFRRKRVGSRKRKTAGFTLLELLISMIVAGLVITILLNLVIDLLQTDRREYARTETQREMQMAMDFIVNDVREAVYVYDNNRLNGTVDGVPALRNFLPAFPSGFEPVLALWRPEAIDDSQLPTGCNLPQPTNPSLEWTKCRNLRVKRRIVTLVVYLQAVNPPNDPRWKGISRIMRYELRQYDIRNSGTINVNNETPGYVEPLTTEGVEFKIWPYAREGTSGVVNKQLGRPADQNRPVLVDFVDFPTQARRDNLNAPAAPTCPVTTSNYTLSPPPGNPSGFDVPSFAACVSSANAIAGTATGGGGSEQTSNQDVIVFIRGNPTGKAGVKVAPLLSIRTQAVARGVVNKTPVD